VDDDRLQAIVSQALESAADYLDEELSPVRVKASEYYAGEPFGDEVEGQSQVVSRDVSDVVRAILPSLVRVFTGSERAMEYIPQGPEDEAAAEQATDYVNYLMLRENRGFTALYSAFSDALIRGTGVIKTWWDDSTEVEIEKYEGLDDETLQALEVDAGTEILKDSAYPDEDARPAVEFVWQQMAQEAMMTGQPPPEMPPLPMLHDVTVRRKLKRGRIRIEAVPPEEILVSRGARSFDDAELVAHRVELTRSQLIAMGYDADLLDDLSSTDRLRSNDERLFRSPEDLTEDNIDPAQRKILYTEAWMPLDADDDGIAELRKICCLGDQYKMVRHEWARYVPLADFCPLPEPHRAIGKGVSDLVMDIQRIKSRILRSMLDSLVQSIHPRTAAVEGEVNMDDLLNNEVGGVVRVRRPGMVQPLETPFVGQQAFPMLEYMDDLRASRTGISDSTQGLDKETMQSTTRLAVQQSVQAAQQQIELIARVFSETGMRKLYTNLLKLVAAHQDKPRVVRLRNTWVPIDPRGWNVGMDCAASGSLSPGLTEERVATLLAVADRQEKILMQLGPQNPLVSLAQYSNTLRKLVELGGYKDAGRFFNEVDPNEPPPDQPQQQSDPAMLLAEVQREEIQANIQKKAAELQLQQMETEARLQLQREQMLHTDDRERDRQESDVILRAQEIGAKYGQPVDLNAIFALMNRPRGAP